MPCRMAKCRSGEEDMSCDVWLGMADAIGQLQIAHLFQSPPRYAGNRSTRIFSMLDPHFGFPRIHMNAGPAPNRGIQAGRSCPSPERPSMQSRGRAASRRPRSCFAGRCPSFAGNIAAVRHRSRSVHTPLHQDEGVAAIHTHVHAIGIVRIMQSCRASAFG